ncbi:MAG: hypothetical protein RLZZ458_787, partial [Planctomycetota bacterium]
VGAGEEEVDEAVGVRWGVDGRGRPSYGEGGGVKLMLLIRDFVAGR